MFFSKFPVLTYPLKVNNTVRLVLARNILRRIALSDSLKSSGSAFIEYSVKDGERPEHIAERIYGNQSYHWIVLLTNDIINPYYDWYRSANVMAQYVQKKHSTNSVYFTDASDQYLYSTQVGKGATLQQGNVSASVVEYHPTMCKITVNSTRFDEGSATIVGLSGNSFNVWIHRTESSLFSAHHFEIKRGGTLDFGATDVTVLDPLSQQISDYSYIGGVIGATSDVYPTKYGASPYNYVPTGTVDFHETYIGKYMGVCGDKVNTYSVNNRDYELAENDKKRTIKLLHPRFLDTALNELDSLLRV